MTIVTKLHALGTSNLYLQEGDYETLRIAANDLDAAYGLLERWCGLFEASGIPTMSSNPEDHPILSLLGETRKLLREKSQS